MTEARPAEHDGAPLNRAAARGQGGDTSCFAALDLGTNNCRLLIAAPAQQGFRVVEAFSRIVRLGEGLTHSGRLDDEAMARAMAALQVCAEKIRRRRPARLRAVATQACRSASNGGEFIARVEAETGLKLTVITPREEARLSVVGCASLLDLNQAAALVVDVGGGSTELSFLDLRPGGGPEAPQWRPGRHPPPIFAWLSAPLGVVSLAERFPEPEGGGLVWYRAMVEHVKAQLVDFRHADPLRPLFENGEAHLVGTSGAITSLAGLHLGLPRYERSKVDGLWLTEEDCRRTADRLLGLTRQQRAAEPCIGPDRADLVLAGAAILQGVQEIWPCQRVRVADRGLREGLLLSLIAERGRSAQRRRRRRRKSVASEAA